jgi:hypothetical protein
MSGAWEALAGSGDLRFYASAPGDFWRAEILRLRLQAMNACTTSGANGTSPADRFAGRRSRLAGKRSASGASDRLQTLAAAGGASNGRMQWPATARGESVASGLQAVQAVHAENQPPHRSLSLTHEVSTPFDRESIV